MSALDQLIELSQELENLAVKEWKANSGKVVGYVCSYVPEEIIHAAGLLPYRVSPLGCTETPEADAYMSRLNCTFSRASLEYALEGKFNFLDGLVAINSCDHIRRMWDMWRMKASLPYAHMISVPHHVTEPAVWWLKDELDIFRESLEKAFGTKITNESLDNSIKVFNRTRELLNQVYELRDRNSPPIRGSEVLSVIGACLHMPREKCNELLEKLIAELKVKKGTSDYRARLLIAGSACDDPAYLKVFEDAGGLVVADTLCFGSRYIGNPVKVEGNIMLSIASAYMQRPLCASMIGGERERLDYMLEMAKKFKVDGIVFQKMRWCDLWGGEALSVGEKLKELGVPLLVLEREYWLSGVEQLKTRVQAFLEVVGK